MRPMLLLVFCGLLAGCQKPADSATASKVASTPESTIATVPAADPPKIAEPPSEKEAVTAFLRTYHNTPFAERKSLVVDPAGFASAAEGYYKDRPFFRNYEVTVDAIKPGPKQDYLTVASTVTAGSKTARLNSYLARAGTGYKLDWAATTGFNSLSMKAFQVTKPATPTEFRAECQLANFYLYAFENAEPTHYSISMAEDFGGNFALLHGYAAKQSKLGQQLYGLLKDGQKHRLILEVRVVGPDAANVEITKVVSTSWVR